MKVISNKKVYPVFMINSSSFSNQKRQFPPEIDPTFIITPTTLQQFARQKMFSYLASSLIKHQIRPKTNWFNPDTPFENIFGIMMGESFLEDDMWYLWCTSTLYNYPIIFPTLCLKSFLQGHNENTILWEFLSWYQPIHSWLYNLDKEEKRMKGIIQKEKQPWNPYELVTVAIIHRPYFKNPSSGYLCTQNQVRIWATYPQLKIFLKEDEPPFYQSELILELHKLNKTQEDLHNRNSSCSILSKLDVICPPEKTLYLGQITQVIPPINVSRNGQAKLSFYGTQGQVIMNKRQEDEECD